MSGKYLRGIDLKINNPSISGSVILRLLESIFRSSEDNFSLPGHTSTLGSLPVEMIYQLFCDPTIILPD